MSNPPPRHVLIVDDDRFMRMTIKALIATVGRFTVEEAADGVEALGKLADFRPDLVVCDVGMAPMGGVAFIEALRGQPDEAQRAVPVIMLTADATESTILTFARLRISGYLLKPVSAKRLAALFHTIFEPGDAAVRGQ